MALSAVPGTRQQDLAAALLQQYVLTCSHHGRGVTATAGRGATVTAGRGATATAGQGLTATAGQGATATAGRGATATASRGYRTRVRTTALTPWLARSASTTRRPAHRHSGCDVTESLTCDNAGPSGVREAEPTRQSVAPVNCGGHGGPQSRVEQMIRQ